MSKKITKPETKINDPENKPLTNEIEQTLPYTYEDGSMYYPVTAGRRQVFFVDISFFESDGNNSKLHYVDRIIEGINLNLKDLEAKLNPVDFMRISNTKIINLHESAGLSNEMSFIVLMKKPRTIYGQRNNAEGGEIELIGSPSKKEEYLKRQERFGIDIKRR
jgi:DNA-binding LytR/AlgR family response regulator